MIRAILLFWVPVALLVAIGVWLSEHPGHVRIDWRGYQVETSFALLALAVVVLAALVALLYRLWRAFLQTPRGFMRYRRDRRRHRGYQALTRGMVAVAAGDPQEARRAAEKAEDLLSDPPLTMLLSAQAAQLNGDDAAAKNYFQTMLDHPDMEFLGIRGLLTVALREGDRETALQLARRAYRLRHRTPWVLSTLLELQTEAGRWAEAEETLKDAQRAGLFTEAEAKRRKSELLYRQSLDADHQERVTDARDLARKAHHNDPAHLTSARLYARLLMDQGKTRKAARVIEDTWQRTPDATLADLYRALYRDESAPSQLVRMQRLAENKPDHPVSHAAIAEAALRAERWEPARAHLERLVELAPSARVFRMMAELEEKQHNDAAAARRWLERAAAFSGDVETAEGDAAVTPVPAATGAATDAAGSPFVTVAPAPAGGTGDDAARPRETLKATG